MLAPSSAILGTCAAQLANTFGLELLREIGHQSGQNVVFSPISLQVVLSMLLLGSTDKSTTHNELSNVMGFGRIENSAQCSAAIHPEIFKSFIQQLDNSKGPKPLLIGNLLVSHEKLELRKEFEAKVRNNYGAESVSFNDASAGSIANQVNEWVSKKTNKSIDSIVDEKSFNKDTRAVLVNTLKFKARWAREKFYKTVEKMTFNNEGSASKAKKVQFIRSDKAMNFGGDEKLDAKVVEMELEGGEFSLVLLVPNKLDGLAKLKSELSEKTLRALYKSMQTKQVEIFLPEFSFEYKPDMIGALEKLGLKDVFKNGKFANLSTKESLSINQVVHKAKVDVNEHGVEASAATVVEIALLSSLITEKSVEFIVDRPFMFIIKENENNAPLFIGAVSKL